MFWVCFRPVHYLTLNHPHTKTIPYHLQKPCTHKYEFLNRCISLIYPSFHFPFRFDSILAGVCIGVCALIITKKQHDCQWIYLCVEKKSQLRYSHRDWPLSEKRIFEERKHHEKHRSIFFGRSPFIRFVSVCVVYVFYIKWTETPPSPLRKFHL